MFAKLVNGIFIGAPSKLRNNNSVVYNPPEELYLEYGWKPVTFTDEPEASSGYYYESGWEETETTIVQTWMLTPLPDDIGEAEAWEIIFGGNSE